KIGDTYSNGALLSGTPLRGFQLQSDERMLPSSLRGFAPLIEGIAATNATVTIVQNGNEIYSTTVTAGRFLINDLYASGANGDLTVNILEADGSKRSFVVPYTSTSQLLRPGKSKYDLSIGAVRNGYKPLDEHAALATWQYGLNNTVTLNSALT